MKSREQGTATRLPRLKVIANGIMIHSAIQARISSTSCAAADSFSVSAVIGSESVTSAAFWSSEADVTVDLRVSIDGIRYVSLIQGKVDNVSLDPIMGSVQFEGRDFTAGMLSSNVQESFTNRTASEIVSLIATRHGLNPIVSDANGLAGNFDTSGWSYVTLNQFCRSMTDWDLLVSLTKGGQFDLFVNGTNLYFQPAETTLRNSMVVTPGTVSHLRLERTLALSQGYEVIVKSWNSWQQQAIATAGNSIPLSQGNEAADAAAQPRLQFLLTRPNLTSEVAEALVQQQLSEIGMHERVIEFDAPGELTLTTRDLVELRGTNTEFDQTYFIESIDRQIGPSIGFVQSVRAKNASQ